MYYCSFYLGNKCLFTSITFGFPTYQEMWIKLVFDITSGLIPFFFMAQDCWFRQAIFRCIDPLFFIFLYFFIICCNNRLLQWFTYICMYSLWLGFRPFKASIKGYGSIQMAWKCSSHLKISDIFLFNIATPSSCSDKTTELLQAN